jgi:hypothetical protein
MKKEMMFWESLEHNIGSFPAIFVPIKGSSTTPGFAIRFIWATGTGFDHDASVLLRDPELLDTYWTVLDSFSKIIEPVNRHTLSVFPKDMDFLSTMNFQISGASLGLAMFAGLYLKLLGIHWPKGLWAWGNIRPVRNNSYLLYEVDKIKEKLEVASAYGVNSLLHQECECGLLKRGLDIRVARDMSDIVQKISLLIKSGG